MKNNKIFNSSRTKAQRKFLRNNMTQAEIKLWSGLKGRQLSGIKFRRQHGIGDYIVDFYCPELKLVVEVDGDSHYSISGKSHDLLKDDYLKDLEITVIRFSNTDILENTDGVFSLINDTIIGLKANTSTTPDPSLRRRGKK